MSANNSTANEASKRTRLRWHRFRWLLLLLFVVGYISTFSRFESCAVEYLGLTLLSVLACCLLLSVLNRPIRFTLAVWLILFVFAVAYYFKFYLIVCNPEIVESLWFPHLYFVAESPGILLRAYAITTCTFSIFCFIAWLFLVLTRRMQKSISEIELNHRFILSILVWLIPVLMVLTGCGMYITGIARMGVPGTYLPLRLAGWMFYTRFVLIPALLLLLVWCGDRAGLRKYSNAGIALLLLHGVSELLLRSSRGALLGLFMLLVLLFVCTGRMTKYRLILFIAVIIFTVLVFPVISDYRYIRAADEDISITEALEDSIAQQRGTSLAGTLGKTGWKIVFRITGIDSLLAIQAIDFKPLGLSKLFDSSTERFYTNSVLRYPISAEHSSAPSLPGWFYLVNGAYFAVIGVSCFIILTLIFWYMLIRVRLLCQPVAQAMFLYYFVFRVMSEGNLGLLRLDVYVLIGSIAACEFVVRQGVRYRWLNNYSEASTRRIVQKNNCQS